MTPEPLTHTTPPQPNAPQPDLTRLVVPLLKGVQYREDDAAQWAALLQLQARVRDYVAVLALDLVVDEAEGYAFVRAQPVDESSADKLPRLVRRQPLSFQVSLLLALLRKKLAEFDASGGDTRLILTRSAVVELVRVFLPTGSNESKLIDQIDTQMGKVVELGFVRRLKTGTDGAAARPAQEPVYEVRRILKAFVDAQWLADFDERLAAYQRQLLAPETGATDGA
ncbi:MAG: DUF4194 domain-containing protein [Hydrogenophaga sp.]|uniref:DUF4194 domain-containing protein n=1 Tax=Hydrogenophaga sp. TaxID=1904254 RepID=UPI00274F0D39|nr:DUF4194 domain-containing protein [Hydrogenophaga sp.]MDP2416112.1 DUF4194 domain-containing protein [Hydrogenophaga sp.]MDZ4188070.1 DUF4194 domain-containing protein [Hydrogenophaga sp.]